MVMFYPTRCNTCGHKFTNRSDENLDYDLFRCVDCNAFKKIKKLSKSYVAFFRKKEIGVCDECQGRICVDNEKRCPKCFTDDIVENGESYCMLLKK